MFLFGPSLADLRHLTQHGSAEGSMEGFIPLHPTLPGRSNPSLLPMAAVWPEAE